MAAIPWGLIIKIVALLAIIGAAIAGISYVVDSLQDQGREMEKAKNLTDKAKEDETRAIAFGEAVKRVQDYRDEQERNLIEVMNGKDKAIADLEKRERAAIAAGRGLYISSQACSSPAAREGETTGPGLVTGGSGRVRLSLADESNVRTDYGLAQRVVIQYNACREKLRTLVIVDDGSIAGATE